MSGSQHLSNLPIGTFSVVVLLACTTEFGDPHGSTPVSPGVSGMGQGSGNSAVNVGGASSAGSSAVSRAGTQNVGGSAASTVGGAETGGPDPVACTTIEPGRAPLRRLTIREFNNTVRDLLGDTTNPGNEFPSEIVGKGFGNDADLQSVSDVLAEKYYSVAETIANNATNGPAALAKLHTCARDVAPSNEEACVGSILNAILPRAYRRPVTSAEVEDYVGLYRTMRASSTTETFASGVAAALTAMLQAPEFLYRPEFGVEVDGGSGVKRLTGSEIATRLSYLFWQTIPDAELSRAATAGELDTREGVLAQAKRMLAEPRSRAMVAFFFDNLLPISDLPNLTRSETLYPKFSAAIGAALRTEVHRFLEHGIFEDTSPIPGSPYAPGSWPSVLTAPYTFVNRDLFEFYGASSFAAGTSVTGSEFQKVELDTSRRLGLVTLAGVMAGTTTTNLTNPVLRGAFITKHLMCREIPLPNFAVAPPEPYTGKTARERYSKHSADAGCAGCHQFMDPLGLALENYDAVGQYRVSERVTIDGTTYDTPIDASGAVPGVTGTASGPVELVRLLASSSEVVDCFATHWMQFAYGRLLDEQDACNRQRVGAAFEASGYDVKELLLALTQADAFRYIQSE